jgi:hypothetical protein
MAQRFYHGRGGRPQMAALGADPAIARAFALTWQHPPGQTALVWLLRELDTPIYHTGEGVEVAVAQCVRIEVAELIREMVMSGRAQLEAEEADAADLPAEASVAAGGS